MYKEQKCQLFLEFNEIMQPLANLVYKPSNDPSTQSADMMQATILSAIYRMDLDYILI